MAIRCNAQIKTFQRAQNTKLTGQKIQFTLLHKIVMGLQIAGNSTATLVIKHVGLW